MKALRTGGLVFLTANVSGCISVPRDSPRKPPLEASSLGLSQISEAPADATWWAAYSDPQLDDLMRKALADNPTLAEARARVRQAQAAADFANRRPLEGTRVFQFFLGFGLLGSAAPANGGGVT